MIASALLLATAPPTPGVAEAAARHDESAGRIVHVRGDPGRCHRFGCAIAEKPGGDEGGAHASVGASPSFDRAVRLPKAGGRAVPIVAEVTDRCRPGSDPDFITVCTDRGDRLRPIRLIEPSIAEPN